MNAVDGKIYSLSPMSGTSKSGNQWNKTEVVIDLSYPGCREPEYLKVDFFGEAANKVNNDFMIGDRVNCYFRVRSRNYNGNWYQDVTGTELEHFKTALQPIQKEMAEKAAQQQAAQQQASQNANMQATRATSQPVQPQRSMDEIPF